MRAVSKGDSLLVIVDIQVRRSVYDSLPVSQRQRDLLLSRQGHVRTV